MKKIRSQILLTPELEKEVKNLAEKANISMSEAIRMLLTQSLGNSNIEKEQLKTEDDPDKIYSLDDFTEANPRIRGLKELFTVGATIPNIVVIKDSTFRYYLQNNDFPSNFKIELQKKAQELESLSVTGKLVLRRAYVVPGLENPPGPRFLGFESNSIVTMLKQLYDFAIEHKYYVKKKSAIVAFMYPFVDPKPLQLPIPKGTILPYGGYAVPMNEQGDRVEVFAVWGNNEGVQSFDAIDRYIIDANRQIILEKDIPQKNFMLATTLAKESELMEVPLYAQFQQILNDFEIIEMARIVRGLTKKYGPRRTEFSFDGRDKLICNESAPYEIIESSYKDIEITGKVITIEDVNDVSKLVEEKDHEVIIYISPTVVQQRAYDVLNTVAGLKNKYTVLYPGLSATAHAMRVLSDFGHTAVVVGNRRFSDGESISVVIKDGEVNIEKLNKRQHADLAVNLYDAKLYGVEKVGGKSLNLSILKSRGFNVPHGIALTTDYFDYEVKNQRVQLHRDISALYERTWEINKKVWDEISNELEIKPNALYAVRSSATVEDNMAHSFAGQFESYLKVPYSDLPNAVGKVLKSTFAPSVLSYFKAMNIPFDTKMGVVVQEMADAKKAGVIFGKDIQTHNDDIIVIDSALGLAEGVVDGTAITERLYFSRSKHQLVRTNGNDLKLNILTEDELFALIDMTLSVENLMQSTQDIEWVIDHQGHLWVIQTRAL